MDMSVYEPVGEIETLVRKIDKNCTKWKSLDKVIREKKMSTQEHRKAIDTQHRLTEENDDVFDKIDDQFKQAAKAIRRRKSP